MLVIPFYIDKNGYVIVAVLKRRDNGKWQFIAGGGEDNETALLAAKRESLEEGGSHRSREILIKT